MKITSGEAQSPLPRNTGKQAGISPPLPREAGIGVRLPVQAEKSLQSPQPAPAGAEDRLKVLFNSLKIPYDGLSKNTAAFARYFSLPLEPRLITLLRREAVRHKNPGAAALAGAAAAGKGVELRADLLEEYAAAIGGYGEDARENRDDRTEPYRLRDGGERGERGDSGSGRESGGEHDGRRGGGGSPGDSSGETAPSRGPKNRAGPPGRDEINAGVSELLAKKPLLRFLNALPGKNGLRWVVLPFSFSRENTDYTVSLRILLAEKPGRQTEVERFAADIRLSGEKTEERRWLFILDKPGTETAGAILSIPPGISEGDVKKEFAGLFALKPGRIVLQDWSPFADSKNEPLRSVDEAV